jgi:hypothetical protein
VLASLGGAEPAQLPPGADEPAAAALARAGGSLDARLEDFALLSSSGSAGGAPAQLDEALSRRWAALALRGEDTAALQGARNASSRRDSAAELMGRAQLAAAQAGDVMRPSAEVRALSQCSLLLLVSRTS